MTLLRQVLHVRMLLPKARSDLNLLHSIMVKVAKESALTDTRSRIMDAPALQSRLRKLRKHVVNEMRGVAAPFLQVMIYIVYHLSLPFLFFHSDLFIFENALITE